MPADALPPAAWTVARAYVLVAVVVEAVGLAWLAFRATARGFEDPRRPGEPGVVPAYRVTFAAVAWFFVAGLLAAEGLWRAVPWLVRCRPEDGDA